LDWAQALDAAALGLQREKRPSVRAEFAADVVELAMAAPASERDRFTPTVPLLVADPQAEVRKAGLALAAHLLPADEAVPLLVKHLTDPAVRVRVEAAGQLADLAQPDTRGALAAALEDEALQVRFEAARGMVALGHPAGFDVLVEALDDADLRFRSAAALARLGKPEAVAPLKAMFSRWLIPAFDKTQLAGALARFGDPVGFEWLFKRAAKKWTVDRPMAVELLGDVKAPGARERLLQIVADPLDMARGAAARGLGWLGDASVVPDLERHLDAAGDDDGFKLDLSEALLRLDAPRARARLATLELADDEARSELKALLEETA